MLGKTHRPFGLLFGAVAMIGLKNHISVYADQETLIQLGEMGVTLAGALVGSTWPDIDVVIPPHRGITHTVWPLLLELWLAYGVFHINIWAFSALFGFFLGNLSHLVTDAFSKAGIAWFYPFQQYERFGNGAMYVKGFRGPFVPLYKSGEGSFPVHKVYRVFAFFAIIALVVKTIIS